MAMRRSARLVSACYWNGAAWTNIGAASAAGAKTLTATTLVRFAPAQDFNGTAPTLTAHLIESSGTAITNGGTVDLSGGGATGGTTQYSTGTVVLSQSVTPVNDAPTSTGLVGDTVTWTENGPAVKLDLGANAALADVDSANFDTGTLTVSISAGKVAAQDQLGVVSDADVTVTGGNVTVGGTVIATFTGGGAGGGDLVFAFNSFATPATRGASCSRPSRSPTRGGRNAHRRRPHRHLDAGGWRRHGQRRGRYAQRDHDGGRRPGQ